MEMPFVLVNLATYIYVEYIRWRHYLSTLYTYIRMPYSAILYNSMVLLIGSMGNLEFALKKKYIQIKIESF